MATDLDAPITAVTVFRDGARVVRTGVLDLRGRAAARRGPRPAGLGRPGFGPGRCPRPRRGPARGRGGPRIRRRPGARGGRAAAVGGGDAAATRSRRWRTRTRPSRRGWASPITCPRRPRPRWRGRWGSGGPARTSWTRWPIIWPPARRARWSAAADIAARTRAAERELKAAEQRLADAERRAGAAEFTEVSAAVEATAATRVEIELAYHVPGASWQPLYDLGLAGERLTVSYLAQVTQRTGEDWPAVPLVLSTTRQRPAPRTARAAAVVHQPPLARGRLRAMLRHGMAMSAGGGAEESRCCESRDVRAAGHGAAGRADEPPRSASRRPGRSTACRGRSPCPPTATRTRPRSPGSTSTRPSTTSRCRSWRPRPTCGRP